MQNDLGSNLGLNKGETIYKSKIPTFYQTPENMYNLINWPIHWRINLMPWIQFEGTNASCENEEKICVLCYAVSVMISDKWILIRFPWILIYINSAHHILSCMYTFKEMST